MRRSQLYEFIKHARDRMTERKIQRDDVVSALNNGIIIQFNRNAQPCPCCLVLGRTNQGNPLHVAVAIKPDGIRILTTYEPDAEIWGENLDTKVVK